MSDPKGFLKYKRETPKTRKVADRVKDYEELYHDFLIFTPPIFLSVFLFSEEIILILFTRSGIMVSTISFPK